MSEEDPKSNLISFRRGPRKGTLEPIREQYDACKHESVDVRSGVRQVTCQKCGVLLDAFTVLYELAKKQRRWLAELDEWDAMRDSRLSDRYDKEWDRDHNGISTPPDEPEMLAIWNTFSAYFGDTFCGMYRRKKRKRTGPAWYGKSTSGGCVSLEYARHQLTPKVVSK